MDLDRFIKAQASTYKTALSEIKSGRKASHWMWYIFPQVTGLGFSEMSHRYAITNLDEAKAYLAHPVLGKRLVEISKALLTHRSSARQIMGSPDDVKLRSCMTLFARVPGADPVFEAVLEQFFNGEQDAATLQKL